MDDVSAELKAFLDYTSGRCVDEPYVMKLDEAVKEAKKNRKWRHEYMTLLMRDRMNLQQGIEQGIEQGISRGVLLSYINMVVRKIGKGKPRDTIVHEMLEDTDAGREEIERIYDIVSSNNTCSAQEVLDMLLGDE